MKRSIGSRLLEITALLLLILLTSHIAVAQVSHPDSERIALVKKKLQAGLYADAFSILDVLKKEYPDDAFVNYSIGVCFMNSSNNKIDAFDYLSRAMKQESEDVPQEIYYYLGVYHHLNCQLPEAIQFFRTYLANPQQKPLKFSDAERKIKMCRNAMALMEIPQPNLALEIQSPPINSSYNEYSPLVQYNKMLVFSSERPAEIFFVNPLDTLFPKGGKGEMFISYHRGIGWDFPYKVEMPKKSTGIFNPYLCETTIQRCCCTWRTRMAMACSISPS